KLLVSRGGTSRIAREFDCVRADSHALYREVFRTGKRVVVSDTDDSGFLSGTPDLLTARRLGIRAFQTTPLYSRVGALVGAISTYGRQPHAPAERDLRLLDILARQAADLIETKRTQETLREANQRKDEFLATLAHELRNPLAPVRYALQVLRLKSSGPA